MTRVSEPVSLRSRPYGADELAPGYDALRVARRQRERGAGLHIALFLLTFVCAAATNALLQGEDLWASPAAILAGVPYAAPLMLILLFHECGHYVLARLHRVDATLPFFIPAPYPFFIGTFGAFIRMRTLPRDRRALFDVGAAGPWAGIAIALPVLAAGLALSEVQPLAETAGSGEWMTVGEPLLFSLLAELIVGPLGDDASLLLHPVALAGWVGLLVTMLNLMPAGQLDGGHVLYAALGPRWHRRVSLAMVAALLVMGIAVSPIWLFWAVLLAVLGTRHPHLLDDDTPLDRRRLLAAAASLVLFAVTFMPQPVSFTSAPPPIPRDADAIPVSAPAAPAEEAIPL